MKCLAGLGLVVCTACGTASRTPSTIDIPVVGAGAADAGSGPGRPAPACTPAAGVTAPTYTQLFDDYFAMGKPGHCATAHCHADPGFNEWRCGTDKDTCYAGMVQIGLIDPADPAHSMIGDPERSPLAWVNPAGNMPFDAVGPYPPGRDAILAWVANCAPND